MKLPSRVSPIQHALQQHGPEWRDFGDARIAWRYESQAFAEPAAHALGLCDLSPLAKLGVKGPHTAAWLEEQGVPLPAAMFETLPLEADGTIIRLGNDEFFLEDGLESSRLSQLDIKLGQGQSRVARVERQEATFLLTGSRALEVFAQTCAINFAAVPTNQVVMTRIAGVNVMVLPERGDNFYYYRLWVDPTFALSLWGSLAEITRQLGGQIVGVAAVFG